MLGGAAITSSTLLDWPGRTRGFRALWLSCSASSLLPRYWRSRAVRAEIVRDGLLKDFRGSSIFIDLAVGLVDDVLDLNLALLRTARVCALSSAASWSSLLPSLECNNNDLSCNCWLFPTLPRDLKRSLGEILTLFIFLFLKPVSSAGGPWKLIFAGGLLVDDGGNFLWGFITILSELISDCTMSSMDPPQFFWQLAPVLKLFPFPPHPPNLKYKKWIIINRTQDTGQGETQDVDCCGLNEPHRRQAFSSLILWEIFTIPRTDLFSFFTL